MFMVRNSVMQHRIAVLTVLAVILLAPFLMSVSAFASTGGGCHPISNGSWRASACISAYNNTVYPDYYIDSVGGACQLFVYIYRNGAIFRSYAPSCVPGHMNVGPFQGGGDWYTLIRIKNANGTLVLQTSSPILHN